MVLDGESGERPPQLPSPAPFELLSKHPHPAWHRLTACGAGGTQQPLRAVGWPGV